MKFFGLVVLLSVCLFLTYAFWGSEQSDVLDRDTWSSKQSTVNSTRDLIKRSPAASEGPSETQSDGSTINSEASQSILDGLEIDNDFLPDLGQDESARVIRGLFYLLERASQGDEEAFQLHSQLLASIRSSSLGYSHVLEAIKRWQNYPERTFDRVGLLEILAESNEFREEVNAIAKKEMVDNGSKDVILPEQSETEEELDESLSTSHDMYAPVTAHRIFLETAADSDQALEGAMMAIEAQDNHNVREAMIHDFKEIHPDQAAELIRYLRSRGIELIEPNHQDLEDSD